MAEAINQNALEFGDAEKGFSGDELPGAYRDYAKALCQMPKEIWKAKAVPSDCEKRILSGLKYTKDVCQ